MATPAAERVVLDTNVLLSATDESRTEHAEAVAAVNEWPASGLTLYTSGQILREYLVVATRPTDVNGLGLAMSDALANVRALRSQLRLLGEEIKVAERLMGILDTVRCRGKQVHDANVVATMLVHGIDTVVTSNVDDFTRFDQYVRVSPLRR